VSGDEVYLDLDDVIRIHGHIFGFNSTVARDQLRDPGALESAILRPRNLAAYQGADLARPGSCSRARGRAMPVLS